MVPNQNSKQKRIMGIWDLQTAPLSLGGLLILIEELQIQRIIHSIDHVDIGIVSDKSNPRLINNDLISALKNMESVDAYYMTDKIEELRKLIASCAYLTWPLMSEKGIASHNYDSTMAIQLFYLQKGYIPYLSCKRNSLEWAMNFIRGYCLPRMPIIVHLKNNPNHQHCCNANFNAWLNFFNNCHKQYDVTFILIGNEEVIQQIRELPNVLIAKDFNSNLSRDLALIQASSMFMGTASGPCNMAVFSDIPYVIFKDPDYHTEEMKKELGDSDHFSFAAPLQKILRVQQTSKRMMSEFDYFYTRVSKSEWKKRHMKEGS